MPQPDRQRQEGSRVALTNLLSDTRGICEVTGFVAGRPLVGLLPIGGHSEAASEHGAAVRTDGLRVLAGSRIVGPSGSRYTTSGDTTETG